MYVNIIYIVSYVCRYFKSHTLLVEQRLEKDKLPEVVRESDAALRYVFLLSLLDTQNIIGLLQFTVALWVFNTTE